MPITRKISGLFLFVLLNGCASGSQSYFQPSTEAYFKNLKKTVSFLTQIQPPRNYQNLKSLNAAADHISQQFSNFGYAPQNQAFQVEGHDYKNIVARIGPKDTPVLVIGAHYDVYGEQKGADDNASGVAALLELARLLRTEEQRLKYQIELVAYTLEEPPFFRSDNMGSHVHALSLKKSNTDVLGMVSLEMVGYYSSQPNTQTYPLSIMKWIYPSTGNFIALVGNFDSAPLIGLFQPHFEKHKIKVENIKAPSFVSGVDFSDHLNYWKYGYQAIMITDTSFYRNPNYHKASDRADTLNYQKMAELVQGIYISLINMD